MDKVQKKVVSNESADLMRMLNQIKASAGAREIDLCPAEKARDIGTSTLLAVVPVRAP